MPTSEIKNLLKQMEKAMEAVPGVAIVRVTAKDKVTPSQLFVAATRAMDEGGQVWIIQEARDAVH